MSFSVIKNQSFVPQRANNKSLPPKPKRVSVEKKNPFLLLCLPLACLVVLGFIYSFLKRETHLPNETGLIQKNKVLDPPLDNRDTFPFQHMSATLTLKTPFAHCSVFKLENDGTDRLSSYWLTAAGCCHSEFNNKLISDRTVAGEVQTLAWTRLSMDQSQGYCIGKTIHTFGPGLLLNQEGQFISNAPVTLGAAYEFGFSAKTSLTIPVNQSGINTSHAFFGILGIIDQSSNLYLGSPLLYRDKVIGILSQVRDTYSVFASAPSHLDFLPQEKKTSRLVQKSQDITIYVDSGHIDHYKSLKQGLLFSLQALERRIEFPSGIKEFYTHWSQDISQVLMAENYTKWTPQGSTFEYSHWISDHGFQSAKYQTICHPDGTSSKLKNWSKDATGILRAFSIETKDPQGIRYLFKNWIYTPNSETAEELTVMYPDGEKYTTLGWRQK